MRQKLLFMWADYWWHHLLAVATKGVLGLLIIGGAAAPVIHAVPVHRHPIEPKPVVAVQPAPKPPTKPPVAKAPAQPPTPAITPAAPTAKATPTATPQPKPVPRTTPAPGSGAKTLVPSTASPASQPTNNTPPSGGAGSSGSNNALPPASGGYTSTNWAGYVALAGSYTSVSGSWKIPAVTGNGSTTSADSTWIGIGGVFSNDLIQTGTVNVVSANGAVEPFAFYELLPDAALEITSLSVSPGDVMSATISETTPGTWSVSLTDVTTGQNYTTAVAYTSSRSSAEWIEEDPSYVDGSLVPFDNFSNVFFANSTATRHGVNGSITDNNGQPIALVSSANQPLAVPSILNSTGNGFNVTRN